MESRGAMQAVATAEALQVLMGLLLMNLLKKQMATLSSQAGMVLAILKVVVHDCCGHELP